MPDNEASTDWFWGLDVSTFALSLGVWGAHGGLTWRTMEIRPRTGPGQLEFPHYLPSARWATLRLLEAAGVNMAPTVVSVEKPVGPSMKPTLTATWGVVLEAVAHTVTAPILTPSTPTWRKTYGIKNTASKRELVATAQRVGYTGEDDNEAEACLIAIAASLEYARSR